jgi:acyl-CoA thioester hydrolase
MRLPQTEGSVLPEWIDNNDHMNLAYYVLLFDLATDTIYDALGIGHAYRAATGNSTFTAETHIRYERELRLGERVRITTHLLGVDAKRLHYFHEMFHAEQGHRVAAQELLSLHIDLRVRRTTPFAPEVLERIRQSVLTGEPPPGTGRRISMSPSRAA